MVRLPSKSFRFLQLCTLPKCIRRWLKEQSTCPTCRTHFLLQDDFPALK